MPNLNNSTCWQAKNKNSNAARTCILTASNFGAICKRKEEPPPEILVKVLCGYNTYIINQIHAVFPTGRSINAGPLSSMQSATGNACTEKVMFLLRTWDCLWATSINSWEHALMGKWITKLGGTGVVEIKYPYGRKEDEWGKNFLRNVLLTHCFIGNCMMGSYTLKDSTITSTKLWVRW